jgi:hypothetical protein
MLIIGGGRDGVAPPRVTGHLATIETSVGSTICLLPGSQ